ncbi:selenocysteine-specific translation elongation factor [Actinophytocola glycyrrhizae]|uniref:Selenocysteine-specific translation elongation factor n=1 Tax=Actinophytocola glycyrrhizae TaxID=2044873 RepID=A0ABV9RUV5_9PSEU
MHVVATAGHVDHGKSTLVRALTGMEPDRLAEERRRGLTIDLGFAWTELDSTTLAFVDVPGHERFVPNMLAGAGPVPAAMFVVAADEGWQAQSAEHLAALDAFGVRHGLLVVTKADRADPAAATEDALERLRATSIGAVGAVAVSGRTGAGLAELRGELLAMAGRLPAPDAAADVRLWVDRVFTIRGAGTVVTGTLGAGTVRVGDTLVLGGRRVVVRGLQALGQSVDVVRGVARVAVNLRGVEREDVRRGDALLTPDAWRTTDEVDVLVRGDSGLHRELVLHLGAAAVPCHVRPLGADNARLTLRTGLPVRAGDIGLLRDPGGHRIACGVEVLDPAPPALRRRGAARAREHELRAGGAASAHLRRHGAVRAADLRALGWPAQGVHVADWVVDPELHRRLPARVEERFAGWSAANPVAAGMPVATLRQSLPVPDDVLHATLASTDLTVHNGLIRREGAAALPDEVDRAVTALEHRLAGAPFAAPAAADLAELGLGPRELAAAERAGRLVRLTGSVVLAADAPASAAAVLATLPAPFTVSDARRALGTTRRVAVPLLERLDADGVTRRAEDGTRRVR